MDPRIKSAGDELSDVSINIPTWAVLLVLSAQLWPLVLVLAAVAMISAFFLGGRWRRAAIVIAGLLLLDLAAARLMQARDDANAQLHELSVNTTLAADTLVDGLKLPAGTEITWADPTHTHFTTAVLPHPAAVLGVTAKRVQIEVDGGWALDLDRPQSIDGWTCQADFVELKQDAHLRRCVLASARDWNGWPIPAATLIALNGPTLGFVFPPDASVMAREIGRPLPATGAMTINADGSLDSVYFDAEAPLVVCNASLWNTVTWRYDPATIGQGRDRKPIAVSGASPAGDLVELNLPGCTK